LGVGLVFLQNVMVVGFITLNILSAKILKRDGGGLHYLEYFKRKTNIEGRLIMSTRDFKPTYRPAARASLLSFLMTVF